ncbi:MAG: ABC transporter permease [Thermomicrobiales bacterium]|nr:ABC transporter permease [Thermomicrobiales bacterium]MCO5217582.1 ABC transporter permease [Thermomicrobiales bacterium]MCO5224112.1 ABC transporter permease [Thermomicrobiales bacterium]MCO5226947.1 ABC transporter permease [Thermomicrobiales bacterium]
MLRDNVRGMLTSAWIDVRSNPFRSLIAMAGMIAAIIAVILVNALSEVSHDSTTRFIASRYGRPATVSISVSLEQEAVLGWASEPDYSRYSDMSWALRETLQSNGVDIVSVTGTTQVFILQGDEFLQTSGVVVSPEYQQIRVIRMTAGDFPKATSHGAVPHVVISERLASSLGWTPETAVGQSLAVSTTVTHSYVDPELVNSYTLTVVVNGVGTWETSSDPTDMLFVISEANHSLWGANSVSLIARVQPDDVGRVDQILHVWMENTEAEFIDGQAVRIDKIGEFSAVLTQLSTTGLYVSGVALVIGGLGILGMGLASVRERSQEYGLRRALGASTTRIFLSVLMQSVVEGIIVVVIAIPVALVLLQVLIGLVIPSDLPPPGFVPLPASSTLLGVVATLAVSLVASLAPAVRAARTSVVQSLRS